MGIEDQTAAQLVSAHSETLSLADFSGVIFYKPVRGQ